MKCFRWPVCGRPPCVLRFRTVRSSSTTKYDFSAISSQPGVPKSAEYSPSPCPPYQPPPASDMSPENTHSVYYAPRKHPEDVNPSGRSQRTRRYFPAEIVRAGHSPRRAQVPRPLARLSCTATAPTAANALSLARAQTKSTRRPVFVRKQNIFGLYVQARPVHAAARAPPPIRRPSHPPATSCCPVRPLPRPLCSESSTDSRSCSVCSTPSCASPSLSSSPVDSGVRRYVPLFCGLSAMSPPPQLRYVLALGFVVRLSAHRRAQRVLDVAAVELYSRPLPARRYVTRLCLTHMFVADHTYVSASSVALRQSI